MRVVRLTLLRGRRSLGCRPLEALALPLPAFLDLTSGMQAALHHSDDHKEAVAAILEKRPPSFTGS